jgi:GntR family transcriptional repressor for pyruvate dehydrogenase complex
MSRLHLLAMRSLITEIADGEVAPGEMLPREVDLAERFGISRGVVRETIRGLEERGLVTVKHGRGATVTPPKAWDVFDPDVLGALLTSSEGEQLAAEARECQRLLELEAAALAADRATNDDLEAISRALDAMAPVAKRATRNPVAATSFREAETEFHRAVVRAAGNRALARMSEPLHAELALAAQAARGDRDAERRMAGYERILAAIAARDPEAAREAMHAALDTRGQPQARRARARAR